MNLIRKGLLLCLFSTVLSLSKYRHAGECTKTGYEYATLSVTWLGQYCSQNDCARNWRDSWNGKGFVIHGYWPSSYDLSYLQCLKYPHKHDPYCYKKFSFNDRLLEKVILQQYWPQVGKIGNFWSYEWEKHGTCYLAIASETYGDTLSDQSIFQTYFKSTVDKFKSIRGFSGLSKAKYSSKSEFAADLGIESRYFYTQCFGDNELDQVRVCYDVASPGYEQMTSCYRPPRECPTPFYMKNYKQ